MMSCGGCCVWPCFCSLFLLFLPSLSTSHFTFLFFLCTELLQVIATFLTLLKSKLHILNIGLCSMLVKMSSSNNTKYCVYECTIWAKCDLRRVYPYVPQFCAAYCTVLLSHRDEAIWGFLTCRERRSLVAMWCINEELWPRRSELSTHIILLSCSCRGSGKVGCQS